MSFGVVRERLEVLVRHPLTWVLVAATAVRVVLIAGVSVSLGYADSTAYAAKAVDADAGNGVAPNGYPLFLRALGVVSDSVDLVLVVQHLLMLVAAVCVYRIARRLTCGRWTAAAAAGVMALAGNTLAVGHAILTDGLTTVLVTVAVLQALRYFDGRSWRDALLLGCVLGAAVSVKTVALPVVALIVVAMLVARPSRSDVGKAAATVGVTVGVIAAIALAVSSTAGLPVVGKSAQGWVLYGRVAPFADCQRSTPPRELRFLCPTAPGYERAGPDYWRFAGGPAVERFGAMPQGDEQLREFALGVIRSQPFDYAKAVAVDSARFFAPNFGYDRPYSGAGWDELELDRTIDPETRDSFKQAMEAWFSPIGIRTSTLNLIARYQELTTVQSGHLGVLLLLGIVAVVLARGALRWRSGFVLLCALAIVVASTALNMYVARYALPAFGALLAVAALGIELGATRVAGARLARDETSAAPPRPATASRTGDPAADTPATGAPAVAE